MQKKQRIAQEKPEKWTKLNPLLHGIFLLTWKIFWVFIIQESLLIIWSWNSVFNFFFHRGNNYIKFLGLQQSQKIMCAVFVFNLTHLRPMRSCCYGSSVMLRQIWMLGKFLLMNKPNHPWFGFECIFLWTRFLLSTSPWWTWTTNNEAPCKQIFTYLLDWRRGPHLGKAWTEAILCHRCSGLKLFSKLPKTISFSSCGR